MRLESSGVAGLALTMRQRSCGQQKSTLVSSLTAERSTDVRLEEVVFHDESDQWLSHHSFSRPWDRPKALSAALREDPLKNKVVRIDDADGRVMSLKDRVLTAAG